MQLSRERTEANVIHAWERGRIRVGEQWHAGHLIVTAREIVRDWRVADAASLSIEELAPAIAFEPEIIVLGTGEDQLLPDVELMAALAARSIGLEIMTTPAACRTYNVLIHEDRRAVAALLNPASAPR